MMHCDSDLTPTTHFRPQLLASTSTQYGHVNPRGLHAFIEKQKIKGSIPLLPTRAFPQFPQFPFLSISYYFSLLHGETLSVIHFSRTMASHIVGYPRMGPKRELKFALESFWDGKTTAEDLKKVAADLRSSIWKQMSGAGIKYIPSNTFSYYDQVLDTTALLGAVPPRYGWTGGEIGFDTYFSMARGNASVPAMEMTKWFDTNYHFIVPELGPEVTFSYASHKAVDEYKEAKALGVDTVPVLVGPVSYLLLSKPAKGVDKTFSLLSLLDKILPVYKEVISDLKAAGATWIQFDEPTLVRDLDSHQLQAFSNAYAGLESTLSGLNVLVETYFADVPAEAYKTLTSLKGVTAYGFDLVRGDKTLGLIKSDFPKGKFLFAGVVDGRNIWANDLAASVSTLEELATLVGKDKLVVSTSCSLLHTAVDLANETKLDNEIKSWLAFAAQKIVEVNALAKALAGAKDEAFFGANAAAHASRKSSPRVTNEAVQKAAAALKGSDHRRATNVSARLDAQQKKLNLPILPTTTIGSFPQTIELRRVRREYKANKISEEEYVKAIKEEISKVVKLQEELDIDVLVHGEPERNDMVEYFGEQLSGFAFTVNGWVQSYGSRCVKPPIIYGDVSRPKAMTVFWSTAAQSMTARPMKGMLTGPVTILNWSFVRVDQPRFETCYQIALAIKDEVEDLEKAGINVIQIDEAALREGLPLRKSEEAFYLDWAVHSFRITNCGVKDTTQIHTHMCYSNFNDIILSIIDMDADVITIENSRSDEKLLSVFREGVKYGAGIGPGVYDIHSPRIPSTEEIADRINKMLAVLETNILWVNPDCGLKTRKYAEVNPALKNMVAAAKLLRTQLAGAK
ncbi:5-methyltetrahydropteroyltriglutamate--homocysteine methyltransferase 1, partial [Cucurbita argyrosperma subsp. sororia]